MGDPFFVGKTPGKSAELLHTTGASVRGLPSLGGTVAEISTGPFQAALKTRDLSVLGGVMSTPD